MILNSKVGALLVGLGLACAPAFASVTFVTSPFANTDTTNWSSLGGDGTALGSTFSATSTGGVTVVGQFGGANPQGLVADVCPAAPTCSWGPLTAGGMLAGDTDVWAFDNATGLGTGPITLNFMGTGSPLFDAGLWIDGDTAGVFTAQIQAFAGTNSLGTQTTTSDASGNPVFLGIVDSTAEVTKLVISLTSCSGCSNLGDFAIDSVLMVDSGQTGPTTPEPSSMLLLGSGLAGMGWIARKRSQKNSGRA